MINKLLKICAVVLFTIILFANASVYAITEAELPGYLKEKISSALIEGVNSNINGGSTKSLILKMDNSMIEQLKKDGVHVYVKSKDAGVSVEVGFSVGEGKPTTTLKFNNGIEILNSSGIKDDNNGTIVNGNDMYDLLKVSKNWVDLTNNNGGKGLYAGVGLASDSSAKNFTIESSTGEAQGSAEVQYDFPIDNWSLTQGSKSVTISEENVKVSNGKWYYYFKVEGQGTYRVNINGSSYGNEIQYKDVLTGENKVVQGGAFAVKNEGNTESGDCVVLAPDDLYFMEFDIGESVTIEHEYLHDGITNSSETSPSSAIITPTVFERIEMLISDFVLSISRVLNWIIYSNVGETVSMDSIVFNQYPDAKLQFFDKDIYGSNTTTEAGIIKDMKGTINELYSMFRKLAIVGYLVILVYIGVRILLYSTTAQKKATYKETFVVWVTGICVLIFMPYFMKYTIALNSAVVNYIGGNNSNILSREAKERK